MAEPEYDAHKSAARANRAFYDAFEKRDLDAMRALWVDDDRAQCVHPGGEALVGYKRVMDSWDAIFRATREIRFELVDLDVQLVGEAAWVSCIERIVTSGEDGDSLAEAAATNLFVPRGDGWLMVLHHASPVMRRFH